MKGRIYGRETNRVAAVAAGGEPAKRAFIAHPDLPLIRSVACYYRQSVNPKCQTRENSQKIGIIKFFL
jgi:hypothetical protein